MPCRVLETPQLVLLSEEVVDGIEDEIDQWVLLVRAGCARHVAHCYVDVRPAGLLPKPGDHVGRELDPVNSNPTLCQWESDPTSTDCELERRVPAG